MCSNDTQEGLLRECPGRVGAGVGHYDVVAATSLGDPDAGTKWSDCPRWPALRAGTEPGPGQYGILPLDPGMSTVNMNGKDPRIPNVPNSDVPGGQAKQGGSQGVLYHCAPGLMQSRGAGGGVLG